MQSSLERSSRRSLSWAPAGFVAVSLLVSPAIAGQEGTVRRTVRNPEATALGRLLEDNHIQAMFKDGTYVKARVQKVESDSLLLSVEESEGPAPLDEGDQDVALSRFSTITVTRYEGCKRAVLGFTLGALGAAASWWLGAERDEASGLGTHVTEVGIIASGIGGGYFLGRHLDKQEVTIIID